MLIMTEVRFYQVQRRDSLAYALPRLLGKIIEQGHRVIVLAASDEQVALWDRHLWTYTPGAFLPHASERLPVDRAYAQEQPIWLTANLKENYNQASVLLCLEGKTPEHVDGFAIICDLFGSEPQELDEARQRWQQYRRLGSANLTYWLQSLRGTWERQVIDCPRSGTI